MAENVSIAYDPDVWQNDMIFKVVSIFQKDIKTNIVLAVLTAALRTKTIAPSAFSAN